MNKRARKIIAENIKYELQPGEHTFTMCSVCNKRGCRSSRCWECWLDILVAGGICDWILNQMTH